MRITGYTRTIVLLGGLLVFIGQSGCAFMHHRPTGSATSVDQLGTIGVVLRPGPGGVELGLPGSGRGAGKRATDAGAHLGLSAGFLCGPAFFICSPALAPVGAVGAVTVGVPGLIYEVLMTEPLEAESALQSVFVDLNLDNMIPDHIISYARAQGYSMTPPPNQTPVASTEEFAYRKVLADQGISTVLEISKLRVELRKGMFQKFNKRRRLAVSVWTRLIRMANGMVISERFIIDEGDERIALADWADDDAAAFRAEMDQAVRRLAKQIVEELTVERTVSPVQDAGVITEAASRSC